MLSTCFDVNLDSLTVVRLFRIRLRDGFGSEHTCGRGQGSERRGIRNVSLELIDTRMVAIWYRSDEVHLLYVFVYMAI